MGLDIIIYKYNKKFNNVDELQKFEDLQKHIDENLEDNFIPDYIELIRSRNEKALIDRYKITSEEAKNQIKIYDEAQNRKDELKDFNSEEIAYFRNHSDLHGYMTDLYYKKGGVGEFNCTPLILKEEDINNILEIAKNDLDIYKVLQKYCKENNLTSNEYEIDDVNFIREKAANKLTSLANNGEKLLSGNSDRFFWGNSTVSKWEKTVDVFKKVLGNTNFENETIVYNSWW